MPRGPIAAGIESSDAFPKSARDTGSLVVGHAFDHLVTIERNTATGFDEWGGHDEPEWTDHLVDVPCLGYARDRDIGCL